MSLLKHYLELYADIDRLADSGDLDTALRDSGMALADCDARWAEAYNAHTTTAEEIEAFALMASQHCELLMAAGMAADAYSTTLIALLQIAHDGNSSDRLDRCRLILYVVALSALSRLAGELQSPTESDRDHVARIIHYLASMLYFYYRRVIARSPEFDALNTAYMLLQETRGSVADKIDVTGQPEPVDPASPLPVLADLIGRSRAMGWMQQ